MSERCPLHAVSSSGVLILHRGNRAVRLYCDGPRSGRRLSSAVRARIRDLHSEKGDAKKADEQ